MKEFTLTPEQIKKVQPALDYAREQYDNGSPGVVIAQIAQRKSGNVKCGFEFIPTDKAKRIREIIQED